MKSNKINRAIALAIKFVQNQQKARGEFKNLSTIFYHALILTSLSSCKDERADKISIRLAKFLIKQKSSRWTFNYWNNPNDHPQSERYPDDWDDTACVLAGLSQTKKDLPGEALSCAVKNLTLLEKQPGGPYYTWITPEKRAREVDVVVNANIAYFLSLQNAFPKGLHDYLQKIIFKKRFSSPYYVGELPVLYFLSRSVKAEGRPILIKYLKSKLKFARGPQDLALGICSLLNLNVPVKELNHYIASLVSRQKQDGSWQSVPFGIEKIKNGKKYYSSSAVFTTALCIEALSKYSLGVDDNYDSNEKLFCNKVIDRIQENIQSQPSELSKSLQKSLEALLANPTHRQIILLPFWTNCIYKQKSRLAQKTLEKLAEANLYGWLAYRIYDDLLDYQSSSSYLPTANWCLINLSQIYYSLSTSNPTVAKLFFSTLCEIESANAWEQVNGRLPKIKPNPSLAQKSFGAALPALAVLLLRGSLPASSLYKQMKKFFWNYLSARQLNDDAHDWQDDLRAGQVNSAAVTLLKEYKKRPIDLPKDFPSLQKLFWHKTMPTIIKLSHNYLQQAQFALDAIPPNKYKNRFEQMLLPIKQATNDAKKHQKQTLEFLSNYGKITQR